MKALEAEDLDLVVRRLMLDTGCDVVLGTTAKREFLRLCALRFLTSEALSPNIVADEFWHTFLVHTKAYRDFCLRHFKRFIDHEPATDSHEDAPSFAEGKRLYRECFGGEPAAWRNETGKLALNATLADRIATVRDELTILTGAPGFSEGSKRELGEPDLRPNRRRSGNGAIGTTAGRTGASSRIGINGVTGTNVHRPG
jgi:hypothetical protein